VVVGGGVQVTYLIATLVFFLVASSLWVRYHRPHKTVTDLTGIRTAMREGREELEKAEQAFRRLRG
jgi:hypothetical protein